MKPNPYRQGDVYLDPIANNDFDASLMKKRNDCTVALGEATGHHHTFDGGEVVVYEDANAETGNIAVNKRGMLVDLSNIKKTTINIEHELLQEGFKLTLNRPFERDGVKFRATYQRDNWEVDIPDVTFAELLRHQEHAPIVVPKGKYRREIQREYSPEEIRNVMD